MADNQKYFLDLTGLTTLWNKIKSTFADKTQTEAGIESLHGELGTLKTEVQLIDTDVTNLETTVLTIAPKEVNYYADAVELSKSSAVGTMISVKYPETSADDDTPSGYATGIYVVVESGKIEYISTSDGDSGGSSITAIDERVKTLEGTAVTSAMLIDGLGNPLNETFDVLDNVLLVAMDDVFDINTDSVKSLTHRAIAAKFKDIENVMTQIPKFKVSVVDELPTSNISLSTIYLLRNPSESNNNLFTEYIYVENVKDNPETPDVNESKYVWEKLGEQTLVIDDFVTDEELNEKLNIALHDYAKKTDVEKSIAAAKEEILTSVFDEVEKTYATIASVEELSEKIDNITGGMDDYLKKEEAALTYLSQVDAKDTYLSIVDANEKGWMTEADIITSMQVGNIGNAIAITTEQIDTMIGNNQ